MTTASVYYNARTGDPDYVLIDGARSEVRMGFVTMGDSPIDDLLDGARRAVDRACRLIGWRVMGGAPIVRQADGRGTIRIEPLSAEQTGAEAMRKPTAWINFTSHDDLGRVAVDGRTQALPQSLYWRDGEVLKATAGIDDALNRMGYVRTTPIVRNDLGNTKRLSCTVEPVADWRDSPTLIRVDDTASGLLGKAAEALGIPADILAAEYVRRGADDALSRHSRFVAPGYILDHKRITGWLPDGSPKLREP